MWLQKCLLVLVLYLNSCVYTHELPYKIPGPRKLTDKIAIVGAGPAGVHMAYLLKEKGFKNIEILEKTSRIGGKSQSINYRGASHEMGTVYISPDYGTIQELVNKYVPGDMVPFPSASVWLDKLPGPIEFTKYAGAYVAKVVLNSKNPNIDPRIIVGEIIKAMTKYEAIHKQIFNSYEGEIMKEPNSENMHKIRGTFMDFIERNNIKALVPIFQVSMTMQGYGHLDEIAALYGLMWNTPTFINGFKERILRKGAGGMMVLKSGFQNLWEKMVKKENIKVTFNTRIFKVYRPSTRLYNGKYVKSTCRNVWICKKVGRRGIPLWSRYNFIIWSPEMKDTMHLWSKKTDIEKKLFSPMTSVYFTTAMVDSRNEQRGQTPIDYWMDNVLRKREHSVWAQRNSYSVINQHNGNDYRNGKTPMGNDTNDKKTCVTYQMSKQLTSKHHLERILLNHFKKINGTNMKIQNLKTWRYFPRYSPAQIENGILWRILEQQGKFNMWYIGSSVSFESVKSVVEYNNLIIKNMEPLL